MKKYILGLALCISSLSIAQNTLIGTENFTVQLPENYIRAIGLNNFAMVQWEHKDADFYGYSIVEHIDEYKLAELNVDLKSISEYALNDFVDFKDYKVIETKTYKTDKGNPTISNRISYFDEENEIVIYYHINVYTSKNFIYKVYFYGSSKAFKNAETDIDYITKKINIPS